MSTILLNKGYVATVDEADLADLSRWPWKAMRSPEGNVYAGRIEPVPGTRWRDGDRQLILMHRHLLGLPPGRLPLVDHLNRNSLDNRRLNLRQCDYSLNGGNRPMQGNRHGFKGVVFVTSIARFRAQLYFKGRKHYSRRCATAEECALAYDEMARRYFGHFACTNFNLDGTPGPAVTEAGRPPKSQRAST